MARKDFFQAVYEIVAQIPEGRVTTYGAIAETLGMKSSARLVGTALKRLNSYALKEIPAHRVVNRKGILTGKMSFPTATFMQERLEAEGIKIIDDKIVNFKELFWHPRENDNKF